jgi:hypothetical protein
VYDSEENMTNDDVDDSDSSNSSSSFAFEISDHHVVCSPLNDAHVLSPVFCHFTSKHADFPQHEVFRFPSKLKKICVDERYVTVSAINPMLFAYNMIQIFIKYFAI